MTTSPFSPITVEALRAEAEASHAEFPQYVGYWADWTLGRMARTVKKGGTGRLLATKGEYVLVKPPVADERFPLTPGFVSVFVRTYAASAIGANVSLKAKDVELLA